MLHLLTDRRILIGVGGGIAAYKVAQLVSTLAKSGAEVRVMMTDSAQEFVTALTFATLSRHPAYCDRDFWRPVHGKPLHIELGEWAELLVIAPLTANTLGKLAYGLADNLLTNTVLASKCPILLAPAMNTDMWEQQSVQRNWQLLLQDDRYFPADPGSGLLACDRVGMGRMAEPEELLIQIRSLLYQNKSGQTLRDLAGKRILISAGATQEYLDPVRFLGNPSTGKMGLALALAARDRGADVTLVYGTLPGELPRGIQNISARTAEKMEQAMRSHLPQQDWIIMCAAVADLKPADYRDYKLPKAELPRSLPLAFVPDIVAGLSKIKLPHQKLIGFAAQTGDFVTPALEKLARKGLDAIVANPIDQAQGGFGSDVNQAVWCDRFGNQVTIPLCEKLEMAHRILDQAVALK
jgi:phosphopantothenoylcysteine decarboxylase / phosphopantothenate---cysteine ligase